MINTLELKKCSIHVWRVYLNKLGHEVPALSALLNEDEAERASHFKFEKHRSAFIIARGMLRRLLGTYLGIPPASVVFSYGDQGKPFLKKHSLQFNISHSDDFALFAITENQEIGVDVEKIGTEDKSAVAKRFFSAREYRELQALPESERNAAFYRVWAKKEALVKALGSGVFVAMDSFSVSSEDISEMVMMSHLSGSRQYHVKNINAHPDYQAALAASKSVSEIKFFELPELPPP